MRETRWRSPHTETEARLAAEHPDEHLRRREFLERTARVIGASAAVAAALGPDALVANAARVQARAAALPHPRNMPVDTFVVLMMENRSFDHYLGWLPGADGRQAGLSYVDAKGFSHATHPLAPDFQGCGHPVPGHIWTQARVQFAGGRCDGFLASGSGNDTYAIGYYRQQDLPFTRHLVREFATCDRWFASLLASTNPNRAYAHAAQSYGQKFLLATPGDGAPQFPTPPGFPANTTIEAALARRGKRALTFYSDDNDAAMWGPRGVRRSAPISEFFRRCGTGKLPTLSFVNPLLNSGAEVTGTSNDDHTYGDVRQSSVLDNDFGQMGFRVPAIVISPYSRRGRIVHTRFGHESILKLVEYRYGLRALTRRDAKANNAGLALDFHQKPRKPPSLPRPPHWISQACPAPRAPV